MRKLLLCVVVAGFVTSLYAEKRLSLEKYRERMTAGWLGQMVGVEWGLPTEFRYAGTIIPADAVPVWTLEMVNGSYANDDLFVEMTFLSSLERYGLNVTSRQAGIDYANSRYGLCAANWAGRENIRRGIAPPDSGHPAYNLSADDIDYQIESDYAGLISPGLPREPMRLANIFGAMVNSGDGLYAGQFIGGMYAAAFFTKDVNAILDGGLACIPPDSQYAGMVRDVRRWHRENPDDWTRTWRKIVDRYVSDPDFHRGKIDQPGSDVKPNGAFVVAGLLYGGGDIRETMRIAMRCGWDSDCNPSSAGGVLATALGLRALESSFAMRLDRTKRFSYTDYTFDRLVRVCEELVRKVVISHGGRVEKDAVGKEWLIIPDETPVPETYRPNWSPPPLIGSRLTADEMAQIHEKPFSIANIVCESERQPDVPLGDKDFWLLGGDPKREVGMRIIKSTNAQISLDNESLPIRLFGLTNTVLHLAWGKYYSNHCRSIFEFSDCSNVVVRTGTVVFCEPEPAIPPPIYTERGCNAITVNLSVEYRK